MPKPCWSLERRKAQADRMIVLNVDPRVNEKRIKSWTLKRRREQAARMKTLHNDSHFAKALSERARIRMKALHADSKFSEAISERMKTLRKDPAFVEAFLKSMKRLHGNVEFQRRFRAARNAACRQKPNWQEAILYSLLKTDPMLNLEFKIQFVDSGAGIADICIGNVLGELDGGGHHAFGNRTERDRRYDTIRRQNGFIVVRDPDPMVLYYKLLGVTGNLVRSLLG